MFVVAFELILNAQLVEPREEKKKEKRSCFPIAKIGLNLFFPWYIYIFREIKFGQISLWNLVMNHKHKWSEFCLFYLNEKNKLQKYQKSEIHEKAAIKAKSKYGCEVKIIRIWKCFEIWKNIFSKNENFLPFLLGLSVVDGDWKTCIK